MMLTKLVIIDDSLAYSVNQEVLLDVNNFRNFDALSGTDYQLYYFPPDRLKKVKIKVWEYQGIVTNSLIADLALFLESAPSLVSRQSEKIDDSGKDFIQGTRENLAFDLGLI